MRHALVFLLAGALLAACGQRGPLKLPGEEREDVGTTTPAVAPAAAAAAKPAPTPLASPIPAPAAGTAEERDNSTRRNRSN